MTVWVRGIDSPFRDILLIERSGGVVYLAYLNSFHRMGYLSFVPDEIVKIEVQ